MHPLLNKIADLQSVPIPPFDLNGKTSDWYWFENNGVVTESESTIILNANGSNGAIVYHMYDGDLSKASHIHLSETFDRHPHLVVVNANMAANFLFDDLGWMEYALTSIKVNGIIQEGYR